MADKFYIPEALQRYLCSISLREPEILRKLREETASHEMAIMQIPPEQGQFMALLVELMGARRTIEIGVFTGYSSLAVALVLPPDGRLVACDVNEEYTRLARRYWKEGGVEDRIDFRLAPALQTLDALLKEGESGAFDFAFIDADKANYWNYYERVLELLRPGGLIAVDNILWTGKVVDPAVADEDTVALREFNRRLHGDPRIALSVLPLADGVTLAMKRTSRSARTTHGPALP